MADFYLLDISPHLRVKVINKLRIKEYSRLRQTCRGVNEFIQSSPHIAVRMSNLHTFVCYDAATNSCRFVVEKDNSGKKNVSADALYGIRVGELRLRHEKNFESVLSFLEKNGITCDELNLFQASYTTDQCVALLKLLRPVKIDLNSGGSTRFEAVFQSRILKNVHLDLNPDDGDLAGKTTRLLSTFPKVTMSLSSQSELFQNVGTILQVLRSQHFPHLDYFQFNIFRGEEDAISLARMKQQFPDLEWFDPQYQEASADVELPQRFPDGLYCKMFFNKNSHYCQLRIVYEGPETLPVS